MARTTADGELAKAFGAPVRAARKASGLSQEHLAEQAGLHRTFVRSIERGESNTSVTTLVRLADVLGVDPGQPVRGLTPSAR